MNELLAIVIIVVLCCVMFLAWLISMAMCPDAMVAFLSGSSKTSNYAASSRESRELIRKSSSAGDVAKGAGASASTGKAAAVGTVPAASSAANCSTEGENVLVEEEIGMARSISGVCLQLASSRRLSDKKLSVVDEVDEQSTLQSTIHSQTRPSILKHPHITQVVVVETHAAPKCVVNPV